jgi:hypothetical protein
MAEKKGEAMIVGEKARMSQNGGHSGRAGGPSDAAMTCLRENPYDAPPF